MTVTAIPTSVDVAALHEGYVEWVSYSYRLYGWNVKTKFCPAGERPPKVVGLMPDIVAVKGDKTIVVDCVTEYTYYTGRRKRRCKAFQEWADRKPVSREFRLAIALSHETAWSQREYATPSRSA